jgi:hypothetical protein
VSDGDGLFDTEEFESELSADESFSVGEPANQASFELAAPHVGHGGHHGHGHAQHFRRPMSGRAGYRGPSVTVLEQTEEIQEIAPGGPKSRVRVRALPGTLRAKWPDVYTMLITNFDGSQILFVRGK